MALDPQGLPPVHQEVHVVPSIRSDQSAIKSRKRLVLLLLVDWSDISDNETSCRQRGRVDAQAAALPPGIVHLPGVMPGP